MKNNLYHERANGNAKGSLETKAITESVPKKRGDKEQKTIDERNAVQEEMARRQADMDAQMDAINSTSAYIEFTPEGEIITANDLFLQTMKYMLSEIKGKHHRIFCDPTYANTLDYRRFWEGLREGKPQVGEFKRVAKDGSDVWLLAHYTPVLSDGRIVKVIKLATDVTQNKLESANLKGQLEAIGKSQAVIEFNMDGSIITANDNFLKTMGYQLPEKIGRAHV